MPKNMLEHLKESPSAPLAAAGGALVFGAIYSKHFRAVIANYFKDHPSKFKNPISWGRTYGGSRVLLTAAPVVGTALTVEKLMPGISKDAKELLQESPNKQLALGGSALVFSTIYRKGFNKGFADYFRDSPSIYEKAIYVGRINAGIRALSRALPVSALIMAASKIRDLSIANSEKAPTSPCLR